MFNPLIERWIRMFYHVPLQNYQKLAAFFLHRLCVHKEYSLTI